MGEPPESLLPAALEQYINTEAAGDESEDDCHSRRTPEAHVEQESSWKLLDKGEVCRGAGDGRMDTHRPREADLPLASAGSDMIKWSRVLLSHTLDAARSY